jgi:TetR/AcrR family transcriptional repressor of nem operon
MSTIVKNDVKQALLEAGISIMLEKGYSNSGISEVLASVGVPKGSFYYYFESKEDFALAMISYASERNAEGMSKIFDDTSIKAIDRLKKYFTDCRIDMVSKECRKGCLIGNLSQEMADQSERLREALTDILLAKHQMLADVIAEAQVDGDISNKRSAKELAELTHAAWMGSLLLAKTTKDSGLLETCECLIFEDILK